MSGYPIWTDDEMVRIADMVGAGMADTVIAGALGRSENGVAVRRRRFVACPIDGAAPRKGAGTYGGRYWTRERALEGLKRYAADYRGPLPTDAQAFDRRGDGSEYPPAARIREYWGTMADAWAAAGAPKKRYTRGWVSWTEADDDFLLDNAGQMTLKQIAKRLGRSWPACKRRLYDLGAGRARDVSGYLSASQVAAEYGAPYHRVQDLIATGTLPARKVNGGHYWRIDPDDCERIKHLLVAPKRTHTTVPPSDGNYRKRYGLKRYGPANLRRAS